MIKGEKIVLTVGGVPVRYGTFQKHCDFDGFCETWITHREKKGKREQLKEPYTYLGHLKDVTKDEE